MALPSMMKVLPLGCRVSPGPAGCPPPAGHLPGPLHRESSRSSITHTYLESACPRGPGGTTELFSSESTCDTSGAPHSQKAASVSGLCPGKCPHQGPGCPADPTPRAQCQQQAVTMKVGGQDPSSKGNHRDTRSHLSVASPLLLPSPTV